MTMTTNLLSWRRYAEEVEIEPKTFKPRIEVKVKSAVCVVRANYESTRFPNRTVPIATKKIKMSNSSPKNESESEDFDYEPTAEDERGKSTPERGKSTPERSKLKGKCR